jgi:hypothetical protein
MSRFRLVFWWRDSITYKYIVLNRLIFENFQYPNRSKNPPYFKVFIGLSLYLTNPLPHTPLRHEDVKHHFSEVDINISNMSSYVSQKLSTKLSSFYSCHTKYFDISWRVQIWTPHIKVFPGYCSCFSSLGSNVFSSTFIFRLFLVRKLRVSHTCETFLIMKL